MNPTDEQLQRFNNACDTIIYSQRCENGIGTLSEKTIHAVLKKYIEPDDSYHEIKIGRYYADIKKGSEIFEIQTRSFNKLRNKLDEFLKNYDVTIVFPIAYIKFLRWIDEATGEISAPRKSPKRGVPQSVFFELYKIKPFLDNPRLHLRIIMFNTEEYRFLNGYSKDKKKGSSRCDSLPTALIMDEPVMTISDYNKLIPAGLPDEFTVKDFARAAKITQGIAQNSVNVLNHLNVIKRIGKKGNAFIYSR